MHWEQEQNLRQAEDAVRTIEAISRERDRKGDAHVTAGRYGELVANMVKYAESQMALEMLKQHVKPESPQGQNVINPT